MGARETVKEFIAAIEKKDLEAALRLVADDAEYDNVPMSKVKGPEGVRSVLAPFVGGAEKIEWIIHRETATGDVVMNERTDRFLMNGKWIEVPVAGVWEVKGGKITLWRDFFDLATFTKQMG